MKLFLMSALITAAAIAAAQDPVFSGPQVGEPMKQFKVYTVTGANAKKEVQLPLAPDKPVNLIFVHNLERSLLPLLRVIDQYGEMRKDKMATYVIFLSDDRLGMENHLPAVAGSIRLKSPISLSLDGLEGPGSYGLNKQCLMTIVAGKGGRTTANFALLQPGIADAPRVIEALAKTCGDENPPTLAALEAALGDGPRPMMRESQPLDLNRLDTSTPDAMRQTIQLLMNEVQRLRAENETLRRSAPPTRPAATEIPGSTPTDEVLLGLVRQFINPANADERVDAVLKSMEERIKGNEDLTKQATGAMVRIIHLKYGTEYALKAAKTFLEKHQK